MAYFSDTRFAGVSLAERFSTFRAAWRDQRAQSYLVRKTIRELQALSDRDLADLGIARSAIHSIATDAAASLR